MLNDRLAKLTLEQKKELLGNLLRLFNEVGPETTEEIDEVLREAGHDPEQVGARMAAVARQAMEEAKRKHGIAS